jgi:hypothetical protein
MTRKVRTSIISIRLMPTPATTRCMLLASWSQRSLGIEKGDYRRLRALEPLTPTLYDHWTDQSGRRFVRAHPSAAFHVPRFRSPLAEVKPLDPFRATKWLLPAFFFFSCTTTLDRTRVNIAVWWEHTCRSWFRDARRTAREAIFFFGTSLW